MVFHIFSNQNERRNFGGSAFMEFQFCKLPSGTKSKKLVAVNSINHWQDDSLYLYMDDMEKFYQEYSHIFNCGTYNNLESGTVDLHGINYYEPTLINAFIEKLCKEKPTDYKTLVEWLNKAKQYNGFYILGI